MITVFLPPKLELSASRLTLEGPYLEYRLQNCGKRHLLVTVESGV